MTTHYDYTSIALNNMRHNYFAALITNKDIILIDGTCLPINTPIRAHSINSFYLSNDSYTNYLHTPLNLTTTDLTFITYYHLYHHN